MKHITGAGATKSPDTINSYRQAVALVLATFAGAFLFASYGLITLALDKGLPLFLAVLISLMLDLPILAFTRAALIQAWRGNVKHRNIAMLGMYLLTTFSSFLQFSKSSETYGFATLTDTAVVLLFTGSPWIVLLAVEVWVGLVTRTKRQADSDPEPSADVPVTMKLTTKPTPRKKAAPVAGDPSKVGLPGYSKYGKKLGRPAKVS